MDDNRNTSNRRINELSEKLSGLLKTSKDGLNELSAVVLSESKMLLSLMSRPLSVNFDAYRSEDYREGGEAYLTFTGYSRAVTNLTQKRSTIVNY